MHLCEAEKFGFLFVDVRNVCDKYGDSMCKLYVIHKNQKNQRR